MPSNRALIQLCFRILANAAKYLQKKPSEYIVSYSYKSPELNALEAKLGLLHTLTHSTVWGLVYAVVGEKLKLMQNSPKQFNLCEMVENDKVGKNACILIDDLVGYRNLD